MRDPGFETLCAHAGEDPTRYLGGPDPLWTIGSDFQPSHRLDNTWFLNDLFLDHFYANGELDRPFNYRTETQDSCGNTSSVSNSDLILYDYPIFDVQHRAGLEAEVIVESFDSRIPQQLETVCFRVAQEALSNVARHAHATHVLIQLTFSEEAGEKTFPANSEGPGSGSGPLGIPGSSNSR